MLFQRFCIKKKTMWLRWNKPAAGAALVAAAVGGDRYDRSQGRLCICSYTVGLANMKRHMEDVAQRCRQAPLLTLTAASVRPLSSCAISRHLHGGMQFAHTPVIHTERRLHACQPGTGSRPHPSSPSHRSAL